jgi:ComF family protein
MMDMLRATSGVSSVLRKVSRAAFDTALDTVLPPQCLACDALVSAPGALCHDCWEDAAFVSAPFCNACGVPFEFDHGPDALCGACTRERPVFQRARAVFLYNDVSRDLITGLKHRDRMHGAPAFGRWLARAGADLVADADWIAPVPLHPLRLWRRRFNQSALLTQALAREADVSEKFAPDLLRRTRATPTQGGLNASQRRRNVRGAFAVQARHADGLRGRRVLLIDDVYTTGATLEACTRALLKAGAETVDALVLARVDRPR